MTHTTPIKPAYDELGTTGLPAYGGYISAAYIPDLYWPSAYADFERIRRSDAEIAGIVRQTFSMFAAQQSLEAQPPDNANDAEKRATDFVNEWLDELIGGTRDFVDTLVNYAPFMGWAWWEVLFAPRTPTFRPPNDDGWVTRYHDGLIVPRNLAFRYPGSWLRWDMDDKSGRLLGMEQMTPQNASVTIPIDRALHITFGDANNPEGLSPLEAVYRLERYKRNLEIVYGIGAEHTAGYVKFTVKEELDAGATALINKAARALLSAQQGNYITDLEGKFVSDVIATPFPAADALLDAIRYYGLLKLQVYNMQWVAIATTAGTGAYAAHSDSAAMGIMAYNGMMNGFIGQVNRQLIPRVFRVPQNAARFAGMERYPQLALTPIEKVIPLNDLGSFLTAITPIVPLDEQDIIAIRRKSGFLPTPEGELREEETGEGSGDGDDNPAAEDTPDESPANLAEFASGEEFSPVDAQLETDEADDLRRLLALALLEQYQSANIAAALRQYRNAETLPDINALSNAIAVDGIAARIDAAGLRRLLAVFAANGQAFGGGQVRALTPREQLEAGQAITSYTYARAFSLLGITNGGTGRIDDPLLPEGLDAFSAREVARLLRQAIFMAQAQGDTTIGNVTAIYNELIAEAAAARAGSITENEVGTLFNAGTFLAVNVTAPRTKTWLRTISRVPRQIHLDQVGVTIPYDATFPDGSFWAGELPNCKCGIRVNE